MTMIHIVVVSYELIPIVHNMYFLKLLSWFSYHVDSVDARITEITKITLSISNYHTTYPYIIFQILPNAAQKYLLI